MIAAHAALDLSWILRGQQIIGHRDDRKENQQQHGQSQKLRPPADALPRGMAHPQPHQDDRQQDPGEIERQFHSQTRFYNRDLSFRSIGYSLPLVEMLPGGIGDRGQFDRNAVSPYDEKVGFERWALSRGA
jgi:hypothetical protein